MRKSTQVLLVLSGALLAGCGRDKKAEMDADQGSLEDGPYLTNGYHHPTAGYYHAHSGLFRPFAYNFYDPARGYYDGSGWRSNPAPDPGVSGSRPFAASSKTSRGGFGSSASSSS